MNRPSLILLLIVGCLSTSAIGDDSTRTGPVAAACEQSRGSAAAPSPADACWVALGDAAQAGQYERALNFARAGCVMHGRSDYCAFLAHVHSGAGRSPVLRTGTGSVTRETLARALKLVHAHDVDDAESGVRLRKGRNQAN
jgi:hypothetical protein